MHLFKEVLSTIINIVIIINTTHNNSSTTNVMAGQEKNEARRTAGKTQ